MTAMTVLWSQFFLSFDALVLYARYISDLLYSRCASLGRRTSLFWFYCTSRTTGTIKT